MSNLLTQEELARAIKYELDTRHTIPAGSNPNDVYVPRIMKLIAKHDKQVANEARIDTAIIKLEELNKLPTDDIDMLRQYKAKRIAYIEQKIAELEKERTQDEYL